MPICGCHGAVPLCACPTIGLSRAPCFGVNIRQIRLQNGAERIVLFCGAALDVPAAAAGVRSDPLRSPVETNFLVDRLELRQPRNVGLLLVELVSARYASVS
jgi:hypothetical protein